MGLIRKLLKLKMYVALVGVGYLMHSCVSRDAQYRVVRMDGKPYLVDTSRAESENRMLKIDTDNFQVGSATYRLRGLFRDSDLEQAVSTVEQEMEAKK